MSVIYIALPVAILMGGAAVVACVICIRKGQFDDLESPAVRMLIDDSPETSPEEADCRDSEAGAAKEANRTGSTVDE